MDQATYQKWWPLHVRAAGGQTLSAEERAFYEAELRQLHASEKLNDRSAELQALEDKVAQLTAECKALERERQELDEHLALLLAAQAKNAKLSNIGG